MSQTPLLTSEIPAGEPPERLFLGWDRAALRSTAALFADHYTRGGELRMDGATVVLPGARAGRRLKELLVEEAERRGARLVPPRVTTLGSLPEELYRPERPVAGDALGRRVWAQALRRLAPQRLGRLYAAAPAESDLRGWTRLAGAVAALHREVSGAGVRFEEVVECCGEGLLFADTVRWSVLAELQAGYEGTLQRLGYVDRGLARIDALAEGRLELSRDVWLVGIVEMPRVAARMLAAAPTAGGRVRAVVQAPGSEASGFDVLGCLRAEAWTARPVPLRDDQIAIGGRPMEQAAEVVRAVAALEGRYAADEIVIASPDDDLVPYVEQGLGAANVPVHAATGTPVERSPVARLLSAVADYLDGRRFEACASLARHPDLGRWLGGRTNDEPHRGELGEVDGWLEAMDTYFTECLPARLDGQGGEGRGAKVVQSLCRALDHESLLGRFRGRRTLGGWMPDVIGLIVEVYGGSELDRARPTDRRLVEACQCLRAAAFELSMLPAELDETCDAATAIRLLLDEVAGASLAPEPDPGAVELLGWLEIRLDDAPVVVVTGFNEPFLPESANAHPFLPNSLRERLGLVDNARRYARDAYELTALLHSRERVRCIAGRRTATGDPLRPSRLMFAVDGPALAERVRRFHADEATSAPTTGVRESDPVPGAGRGFRLPPEPVLRAPEPIRKLRVTEFKRLLDDPYGYALDRVLHLAPLDDRRRELDGLRFGDLAHAVLERFGRSEFVHSTDEERIRRQLDDILGAAARERFGAHALPAVRIQVEQLRTRLHAFARWHTDWIGDGWRVVGLECATPEEGIAFVVDGVPVHLTGRIDRVDFHPGSGAWALFDYKTGDRGEGPEETHRAGKADDLRWTDLQLPLYRHLLPHLSGLDGVGQAGAGAGGEVRLGYITLPRDLDRTGARFAEWTQEELDEADECACAVVRLVRSNEFTFDPTRARAYRNTAFAGVLGIGYLESAAEAGEVEA